MAARQDQTQTIIVIVCSILILLLSIVAYLTWSSAKTEYARAEELAAQKTEAENTARQRIQEAETLTDMIGLPPGTPFSEVQAQYEKDKSQFMGTLEEEAQSYRNVLDYIYTENTKIAQQENEAKKQVKQLQQDLVALKDEWTKQFEAQKAEADKAKRDLASREAEFKTQVERLEQFRKTLVATLAREQKGSEEKVAAANADRDKAIEDLRDSDRSRATLLAERRTGDPTSEVADGTITYVNQANQTAWINLGEADELRRQVTFSVFDSGLSDAGKADRKGSLEVVRVLGDHLAEAKITSDESGNPLLPGDRIYSQVWQPGKSLRFGLTGFIDLDDDGVSDLQRAKDLIAVNGGKVDVSLEEDGSIDGEMTVQTRYLVLGEAPDTPSKASYREGFQTMSKKAANLGVETITLPEFLDRMGYRPAESTFRYTGGEPSNEGGAATSFRFRTP